MIARRIRSEAGVALVWAILFMVVVAGLTIAFTMVARRAGERSADASRRVANAATVQTAVTRVLFGYQNNLGSEQDFYTLDAADLANIVRSAGSLATVYDVSALRGLPSTYRSTYGVWEHDIIGGQHRLVRVNGIALTNAVVEERQQADTRACSTAGLPTSACQPGNVAAYWQVVRVVMPDITGRDTPSVVVTLRTWLGNRRVGAWSKASYARVEMRPGRFADFQLIADGNMHFGDGALINGPVHSNGLADGSFATVHDAPGVAPGSSWTYLDNGVRCQGSASITMRVGRIFGPGDRPACNDQGVTGQTISFLRAFESIDAIDASARARRAGTYRWDSSGHDGAAAGRDPYDTAWDVTLQGTSVRVRYPDGSFAGQVALGRVNAYSFDDDVKVRGTVGADRRLTVAARRDHGASAMIYIDDDIRKGDDRTTSIGLIAEGDVILWQAAGRACGIGTVQAAIVAATGGVTIPTSYTTDEVQSDAPHCGQAISLDGSIAGHRPPTLVWTWPGGYAAGYTGRRSYSWDEQLKRNPPPFFPLTGTWQPFNVRDANQDCLVSRAADPECR